MQKKSLFSEFGGQGIIMTIVSYYYRDIKYPVLTANCQLVTNDQRLTTNDQQHSNPRRTFISRSAIPASYSREFLE